MAIRDAYPPWVSPQFKKNGHVHTGTQNHRCQNRGRQFVLHPDNHGMAGDQRTRKV